VRERGVVLEYEADSAVLGPSRGHVVSVDQHGAGVWYLESSDDPQQRGLARAARPEQCGQRPLPHVERDVVKRGELAEALADRLDVDPHRECLLGESTVMASSTPSDMTASRVAAA
jgi:hypothetical protein